MTMKRIADYIVIMNPLTYEVLVQPDEFSLEFY